MNTLAKRGKAFEDKFQHDEALHFKITVRRNKLLGLWIAHEFLGLHGDKAESYAREVIEADFVEPGDADVIRKIMQDLEAKGVKFEEERLRLRIRKMEEKAKEQIQAT